MGEADRYHDYRHMSRRKRGLLLGQEDNALVWLVAINVVAFLIIMLIQVAYSFGGGSNSPFMLNAAPYFQLPSGFAALSEKPWTLLTYMFSEFSVLRLLSNMLWLWAFGYILQDITGNRKIIPIFIYGGIMGGLFFIGAHYLFPFLKAQRGLAPLVGSNAAVTAIAVSATVLAPGYRILRNIGNGIPIWVLTMVYLLIAFAGVASFSAAYSFATFGGALAGYLFVVMLRRNKDASLWMNQFYNWVINVFNPYKNKNTPAAKEKVFYNTGNRSPYTKTTNITQQRVDEILDKINQQGYHFLTDEEKSILKKAADEDL